ncbi:transposable element Tc3 transposase [Trichonephila clavipes]|nr:transposable element Tc3 transposase [Trichonephila clavipes]
MSGIRSSFSALGVITGHSEYKNEDKRLKDFQCNNRIVMTQRKHLDDFLRGRIIGRLECGRTQLEVSEELGITQSFISRLWQRFQDDGNSRFSLQSDSHRTLIWREPGTRYHQENTIKRHHYGNAGWLVWGGIILGSRTDLRVQSVTKTSHIYRDVILEQHVRLFRGAMGIEFLFMDDNARPHRANIVNECLQSEDITRIDWPAYSPDLNPIEHVWDMLGRRMTACQPQPTCLPELRRALLDEWCHIPQDQIDNLILSMPRRCTIERDRFWQRLVSTKVMKSTVKFYELKGSGKKLISFENLLINFFVQRCIKVIWRKRTHYLELTNAEKMFNLWYAD